MKKTISSILICALLFSSIAAISCAADGSNPPPVSKSDASQSAPEAPSAGSANGKTQSTDQQPNQDTTPATGIFNSMINFLSTTLKNANNKMVENKIATSAVLGTFILSSIVYVVYCESPKITKLLKQVKEKISKATNRIAPQGEVKKASVATK